MLALPLLEIGLFIVVGRAIGLWPTLLLVVLAAVAGALVLKWQGLSLLREIQASVGTRTLPGKSIAEAMMVFVAGILLLIPGFFSDAVALLLLLPPVRSALYHALRARVSVVGAGMSYKPPAEPQRVIDLDADGWRPRE